jgi:7-cyano-7-deazaguanine tRNA-ribosyltransferase
MLAWNMAEHFEILHKDLGGRIGKLITPHGAVETPAFMPVVNPHLQIVPTREIRSIGASMLITNSYIIHQDQELAERTLEGGLHRLLDFDGPVMTDSGAFQLSVYGEVEVHPEEILAFQLAIGSDVCVPLDIPTPPDVPRERAERELATTMERLAEALQLQRTCLLAGPVQGSTYPDLREKAARRLKEMDFDVYPVGGVVPLMEAYRFKDLVEVVTAAKLGLGPGVPVHLFGAGHPMVFALAAAMGCDLFDSAAYAHYARQNRYLTPRGTWKLEDLRYLPCSCQVCQSGSSKELMESPERIALLARHNLYVSLQEIRLVRQCIREGSLWDLLESRCRSHPRMLDALKRLGEKNAWLERLSPISKSTFFYLGPESSSRPEVIRHSSRMHRLSLEGKVLITDDLRATQEFDRILLFKPPFGPVPLELMETYPFNSEMPEEPDRAAMEKGMAAAAMLIKENPQAEFVIKIRSLPMEQHDKIL